MSIAAAQADAFFEEVVASRQIWSICDSGGFPSPMTSSGKRAMPFWSKESRAQKIVDQVEAYVGFEPYLMSLDEILTEWLPDLESQGTLIGINWSGKRATGFDMSPKEVKSALDAHLK